MTNAGIVVNTRVLGSPITGVQRYTQELVTRWSCCVNTIAPEKLLRGAAGHAWEQLVLPARLGGRLLFSPSNTGPVLVDRQAVTIHDMAVFDCPETFAAHFVKWYRLLLPKLLSRVKCVITVSHFTKDRLIEHLKVPPEMIRVIANGVSARFCPEAARSFPSVASSLKLPSDTYLLFLGSLEPRKNLPRLLEAWRRSVNEIPSNVWLVIAGALGDPTVFRKLSLELPPRVFMTGAVSDELLPSLCAAAAGLVYVSLYEGFGLPVLEAMACGVPVIASNSTSLPEVVGDAGALVNPYDIDEISSALCRILKDGDLRHELSRKGLVRSKTFTWQKTADSTWKVLEKLAFD